MAGTLFGIPLSQQVDETGAPISGGLLYVYEANTSTPANTYSDFNLTTVRTWPITLDAAGRVPAFYVDDGSYRARLTTSGGVEIFDEQTITSIGSSSGGSGDSISLDTETIFQTGDMLWSPISGTRNGWVRSNGRTIGSGSSGATERANSDTQSLFEFLWTNFSDSFCAVSSGRGASATADFNANKTIATLDMRSKGIWGLDDMGNSSAGITGASTIAATAVGASTYTIAQANLPNVNLSAASLTVATTGSVRYSQNIFDVAGGGVALVTAISSSGTSTAAGASYSTAATVGGNVPLGGSGTDLDILTPMRVGTYYQKL